ncbi:GspL/Epsl periplasmic domain-containing protein [Pseudomonas vlassakiae]|uniref:Type II secretion system protein GspL n=1 Tax=Pseudomonas vlassakiae TaxID=485888 RepID=A0A923K7I6_9PSED|nr:type II secretion system protein GspL [Pseudomonas vlassakiae]MBV4542415.1 type II secretion system protein GspL [Pseudomonas vlassakiae]
MKFEWRKSATARPWLLLRPGEVWDWLLVEAAGAHRQGQGKPPLDLQARVALIVPGECCSLFQLAAPPGLKRDEWPLLLEDRLLQSPDEILCACLSRQAGQLRLVAVERQLLEPWREQCAEWGLQVESCWAEFQLLPAPEPGSAWQWQCTPELVLCKGLVEDGPEQWLAWPIALGDLPQQPWSGLSQRVMSGIWPTALAPLDNLPSLLDQPCRPRSLPCVARPQLRLLAACLVLASIWAGLWLTQQWRQVQTWRAQVMAVTGEQASPRHAAQALKRLRESQLQQHVRERQLEDLQARLQAWLRHHPAWRLQAVRFDGQRWHLRLDGDGAAPPWAEMASAVGAAVQVQNRQVVFDLGAAS